MKTKQYQEGGYQGFQFIPFSIETFGRIGKPGLQFLRDLSQVAAAKQQFSAGAFLASALRELSIALARGQQAVFKQGLSVYARVSGSNPVSGARRPFLDGG